MADVEAPAGMLLARDAIDPCDAKDACDGCDHGCMPGRCDAPCAHP